jgi:hypothetical protein
MKMKMRFEFICNLPESSANDDMLDEISAGFAVDKRIYVEGQGKDWKRIGRNWIGPPYGDNADPTDFGLYTCLEEEENHHKPQISGS